MPSLQLRRVLRPAVIPVLALAAVLCLMPSALPGRSRAGVWIEVVRTDDTELAGSLIAVRPESLVIANPAAGLYEFVPLADIRIVRIPKVSKTAGALGGFEQGVFYGAVIGDLSSGKEISTGKRRTRALIGGLAGAAAGAAVGGLLGKTVNKKEVIQIKDQPAAELAVILKRLNGLAKVREAL
ncbi:MAG: hypothetical protein PHI34_14840 [Acidobacteriota bacterium]|nr:hypothetical protein [Acidobacteriota bacterium]